jgi:hypothetical protein
MNERDLLVDCLRRLNRMEITYYLTFEPAWIVTAEDVLLHKLVWNRISPSDRQLGDAAGVLAVQADALDKEYLRMWAKELQVAEELERLLSGEIRPKQT